MPRPATRGPGPPALTDVLSSAATYAAAEKAPATRRAYFTDWRLFTSWCRRCRIGELPVKPETVCIYLAHLADSGSKPSTISRRLAAIAYAHQLAGHESPTSAEAVHAVMRGIRPSLGTAPVQKAPARAAEIELLLAGEKNKSTEIKSPLADLRDNALILLGFAAALRRSELVALEIKDLEFAPDALTVHIRRSKTDQEAAGSTIAIPRGGKLGVVEALEGWLAAAQITEGPIFRAIAKGGRIAAGALSGHAVALIIKRRAAAAGLDPGAYSGHSLRSGFVTSALEHGADIFRVMDVTRHRKVETLRVYDRRAKLKRDHPGKDFL
jgi:site-specific recombinase XerD